MAVARVIFRSVVAQMNVFARTGGDDVKTLSLGSSGPEVCVLQTRLNSRPTTMKALAVDGKFGPKTLARVKEFQKQTALVVDGIVGPNTWGQVLAPPSIPIALARYCDNGIRGNESAVGSAAFMPAGVGVAGASTKLAAFSLPSLPTLRRLTASEIAAATIVYGASIDFSTVFASDKTGASGRAFVVAVPNPLGGTIQI